MFFLAIFSSVHFPRAASNELSDQMPDVLHDGLTNEHHVPHMTRLSVAMRCAGIDSDRFGYDASYESLVQLSDATEWWKPTAPTAPESIEHLEQCLTRVCFNEANGNFSIYAASFHYENMTSQFRRLQRIRPGPRLACMMPLHLHNRPCQRHWYERPNLHDPNHKRHRLQDPNGSWAIYDMLRQRRRRYRQLSQSIL